MPKLKPNLKISDYQNFIKEVYGLPNARSFGIPDMTNQR